MFVGEKCRDMQNTRISISPPVAVSMLTYAPQARTYTHTHTHLPLTWQGALALPFMVGCVGELTNTSSTTLSRRRFNQVHIPLHPFFSIPPQAPTIGMSQYHFF